MSDNVIAMTEKTDLDTVWARILDRLRGELGDDICNSWFGRVMVVEMTEDTVCISVPTRFLKNWIDTHYTDRLLSHWQHEFAGIENVCIRLRDATRPGKTDADGVRRQNSNVAVLGALSDDAVGASSGGNVKAFPKRAAGGGGLAASAGDSIESSPLDPRFTFDSYIVCQANELGHAAALQLAKPKAEHMVAFNPLYIHSSVGLGKTHLVQAVAHECAAAGDRTILYLTAEKFMYHFVTAITSKNALAFKDRLRSIDILLIDDMQFLQGPVVKREFSHLLNTMLDSGRQVVIAADGPPSELENLDDRTKSRLSGGLVVELGQLDRMARFSILKQRSQFLSKQTLFSIPDEALDYVSGVVNSNGRDLEGALTRLVAHQQLTQTPITVDMIQKIIQDLVNVSAPKSVKIEEIQRLVAKHYSVPKTDLLSARRSRAIVRPRQVAMYLSKMLTLRSLPEIGRRFGGRDHTTVLHAVRKVEELKGQDGAFSNEVDNLRRMLLE